MCWRPVSRDQPQTTLERRPIQGEMALVVGEDVPIRCSHKANEMQSTKPNSASVFCRSHGLAPGFCRDIQHVKDAAQHRPTAPGPLVPSLLREQPPRPAPATTTLALSRARRAEEHRGSGGGCHVDPPARTARPCRRESSRRRRRRWVFSSSSTRSRSALPRSRLTRAAGRRTPVDSRQASDQPPRES
jgi:hypothetical protein